MEPVSPWSAASRRSSGNANLDRCTMADDQGSGASISTAFKRSLSCNSATFRRSLYDSDRVMKLGLRSRPGANSDLVSVTSSSSTTAVSSSSGLPGLSGATNDAFDSTACAAACSTLRVWMTSSTIMGASGSPTSARKPIRSSKATFSSCTISTLTASPRTEIGWKMSSPCSTSNAVAFRALEAGGFLHTNPQASSGIISSRVISPLNEDVASFSEDDGGSSLPRPNSINPPAGVVSNTISA